MMISQSSFLKVALDFSRYGWTVNVVLSLLVSEHLLEKPGDDWEVLPLVVGREEDGVFVAFRHVCCGVQEAVERG